jgi:hypothetical protein
MQNRENLMPSYDAISLTVALFKPSLIEDLISKCESG